MAAWATAKAVWASTNGIVVLVNGSMGVDLRETMEQQIEWRQGEIIRVGLKTVVWSKYPQGVELVT